MSLATTGEDGGVVQDALSALGETPAAVRFASLLYGPAVPDGLRGASPLWLARNAEEAFAFVGEKPMPGHKVRIRRTAVTDGGEERLVVEILNDDMPFLVDSVLGELQARGLSVRQLLHPILKTQRDAAGRLQSVLGPGDQNWNDGHQESYIAVYLAAALSEAAQADLVTALSSILDEVRLAVADWQPMQWMVQEAARRLEAAPAGPLAQAPGEAAAFLRWVAADNFTFLGARTYRLSDASGEVVPVETAGLGLLRDPAVKVLGRAAARARLLPQPAPLVILKAGIQSRVHRRGFMDCLGVQTYGPNGTPEGLTVLVGLFTSQAYTRSPRDIPLVRHKVEKVLALSGHPAASHDGKALLNVLETFPRDELFQIDVDALRQWSKSILDLEVRPRVRLFARVDGLDRFVTALVYVPRDRYTSDVRERIVALLAEAYDGRVAAFYPYFTDGPLVRVFFVISRERSEVPAPQVETAELERGIAGIIRTWDDRLAEAISAQESGRGVLLGKYGAAFPADYTARFPAERALRDIERMERLGPHMPVAIDFYRPADAPAGRLHAAVYRFGGPISLSRRVPVLENLGFRAVDEGTYLLNPQFPDGRRTVTLHDMVLETADGSDIDLDAHGERLVACFGAVFRGAADNDNFNRLVVSAGADWRSVAVLRACAAYLRQLGSPFGPRYIADTLNRHAGVARDLLELFHLRFDPDRGLDAGARRAAEEPVRRRIEGALAAVPSLDEDRILRQLLNLIGAMVRTTFYQDRSAQPHAQAFSRGESAPPGGRAEPGRAGALALNGLQSVHHLSPPAQPSPALPRETPRPAPDPATLAFKFDSKAVDAAPQPRPYREIWVYSTRVEGIHLRFAPIARGGIRWSDRAQDFRTEVLGLVRAQLVKNAVIVPSGAKGGFFAKQLPRGGTRDAIQKEGVAAYRIFISALLDLTDNLVDGRMVPPARQVRYDGDDPYLVVAADKGTATFSDIANEISAAHDFWLGDAFASGGSAGYDHKGMAITARGAWECVKRHFREMDIDIQRQPFRAVGVGDMSGDVFGNGMLLSEQTRLVAAFDHRDIFIDPEPDAATSFAERRRLFALPRSSWQDYDRTRISRGGGVFSRSAKAIPVSDEMKALLGLAVDSVTPAELVRAILACHADLLWFGGIGTFVRASTERDADVGDRANDGVRLAAVDINAKVIGEGANLGVTQRGRIELAERGRRINTDSIDNSAGVNTSDQEVNIKIALAPAVRAGALDADARGRLLVEMTDDVAAAALRNNYQQSLALSLAERSSARELPDYTLLLHDLEARGLLDRGMEALPSDIELQERGRTGRGLARPELAVLLSYAKIALQHDLLESRVPDEAQLESWLIGYFPPLLRERFRAAILGHSLRREIIALGLTNTIVNRGGPAMAVRLAEETGRSLPEVAHAFMAAREVFDLPGLWQAIDALDGTVGGQAQLALYEATRRLVNAQTQWFLRDGAVAADLAGTIARHTAAVAAIADALPGVLPAARRAELAAEAGRLHAGGVPAHLADAVARLQALGQVPAIAGIAQAAGLTVPQAARVFFEVGEHLRIDELARKSAGLGTADRFDRAAVAQTMAQLTQAQGAFTRAAIRAGGTAAWLEAQGARIAPVRRRLDDAVGAGALTLSRLLVAADALGELAAHAG